METSDTELRLSDAEGDTAETSLSSEQYAWIERRAAQHDMSPAQFVEHVLTRLRRAEAIRERAEQSDTFERVTDEFTLLMPDDEAESEDQAERVAAPPRLNDDPRSLFDLSPPEASG